MRKRNYSLAQVGKNFALIWKYAGDSYWQQYGTQSFASEVRARKHAAVCEIILD